MTDQSNSLTSGSSAQCDFPTVGSITDHSLELESGQLGYRAIGDWVTLRKIHKPVGKMFHTAYLADSDDSTSRPITFVFNGGPGASSAYLHMGALGPRRVVFGANGSLTKPPTQVIDNTESWLKFTDLVFIDPIGTGFSRSLQETNPDEKSGSSDCIAAPEENAEFWEIEKDLDSLGEFIKRFLSKHHRWTSPIFIAGESYGGYRVAKMARRLQETHGVGLCGAMLISPAIEIEGLLGSDYDTTYWVELFPSLVASAYQHGKIADLPPDATADSIRKQAELFAQNELVRWMTQGDRLPPDERASLCSTMANLTGLASELISKLDGRLNSRIFCRELLRDQRRVLGLYDASTSAVDPFPDRLEYAGPDSSLFSIDRLFAGSINHHLRTTLKVDTDLDYRLLSMKVNENWKDSKRNEVFSKMTGSMDDLRYGLSLNEHMQIYISHGFFDLITPYFSTQHLIQLMKLTKSQRQRIVTRNYNGGHMYYSWDASRIAFRDDAEAFFESSLS